MRPQNMTPDQQTAFRVLQRQDLKVARAWALKERFADLLGVHATPGPPRRSSPAGLWRATHSRLSRWRAWPS